MASVECLRQPTAPPVMKFSHRSERMTKPELELKGGASRELPHLDRRGRQHRPYCPLLRMGYRITEKVSRNERDACGEQIVVTLSRQLNWSNFRELLPWLRQL